MKDREMLELAAKAAGYTLVWGEDYIVDGENIDCTDLPYVRSNQQDEADRYWNSLEDNGDAMWLAVKLSIPFHVFYEGGSVIAYGKKSKHHPEGLDIQELFTSDPCAATRRAITRAAAEMEMSKCKDN